MNQHLWEASAGESNEWKFNSPDAPHFGGIFEAGIKSVKTHLNRNVVQQLLTSEEFLTLAIEIETLFGHSALTPINSDPITFLEPRPFPDHGNPFFVPEPNLTSAKISLLSRWQLCKTVISHFDIEGVTRIFFTNEENGPRMVALVHPK